MNVQTRRREENRETKNVLVPNDYPLTFGHCWPTPLSAQNVAAVRRTIIRHRRGTWENVRPASGNVLSMMTAKAAAENASVTQTAD